MDEQAKKSFLINSAFISVSVILIWLGAKVLLFYLLPFVIAAFVAFAVQKPSRYISKRFSVKNTVTSVLITLIFYIALIAVVSLTVWIITVQMSGLFKFISDNAWKIEKWVKNLQNYIINISDILPEEIEETVNSSVGKVFEEILSKGTVYISDMITSAVSKVPEIFFFTVITVVASCYIAKDFEKLKKFFKSILKPQLTRNFSLIKEVFTKNIARLILGYLILTFITFIELSAGFLILKIKYAVAIAAITAFVDLLPVFGSGTVLIPWAIYSFISQNYALGAGLCVIYVIIVTVRYFSEPKIIGKSVGVSPLITLLALFIGLRIGGLAGMILFPLAVIIVINYYRRQIETEKSQEIN